MTSGNTPLSEADRKFLALRDSGYRGPIDRDGNAVADLNQWIEDNRHSDPIRRAGWYIQAEQSVMDSEQSDAALVATLPLIPQPGEVLTAPWHGLAEPLLPALETPSGPEFRREVAGIAVAALNIEFRACEASRYAVWRSGDIVIVDWHLCSVSSYEPVIIRPSESGRYALGHRTLPS